jgi:pyridoxamine 5'-phosphate oxidase
LEFVRPYFLIMNNLISQLASGRKDYAKDQLSRAHLTEHPSELLALWLEDAAQQEGDDYQAMVLSTLDDAGFPVGRVVLARGIEREGVNFFTNYLSEKGRNLEACPRAGATFFWKGLERQVRIRGTVERLSPEESDRYFASRPVDSQLGAWMSMQSEILPDVVDWDARRKSWIQKFENSNGVIPRPPHWGGYQLRWSEVEFWQGRPSRLHDRWQYRIDATGGWSAVRLSP